MSSMHPELLERISQIDLLILDVDGVLTDGKIIYSDGNAETKAFHVRDGFGIRAWLAAGKELAIITGRKSEAVERRASELRVTRVIQGAKNKLAAYESVRQSLGCDHSAVCVVGDDLPDLPLLSVAGLGVAVADAAEDLRACAHHITKLSGGSGAVREVIELILRGQGRWQDVIRCLLNESAARD